MAAPCARLGELEPRRPRTGQSPRRAPPLRVAALRAARPRALRRQDEGAWLNAAIDEYLVRLRPNLAVDCEWVRDDDALVAKAREERGALVCSTSAGAS